jgi:hypothetical protein
LSFGPVLEGRIGRRPHAIARAVEEPLDVRKAHARPVDHRVGDEVGVGRLGVEVVQLGVGEVEQEPDVTVAGFATLCDERVEVRRHLLGLNRVETPDGGRNLVLAEVEWTPRTDVHEAGQARLDQIGGRGLEHFQRRDVGGREILERHDAGLGGKDLAAVIGGRKVGKAANEHARRLAAGADDLHARDAGGGVGHGEIGELADILGHDRVDDLVGIATQIAGRLERLANAGDDDLGLLSSVGFLLGLGIVGGLSCASTSGSPSSGDCDASCATAGVAARMSAPSETVQRASAVKRMMSENLP